MKRSEMIEILRESFIKHMHTMGDCCLTDEEMYSHILQDLEKAGMKPPCNQEFGGHLEKNLYNECNDYVESCNFKWSE